MTPVKGGQFCKACNKCVVDLSNKNQAEIKDLFEASGGQLCGSMPVSQHQRSRAFFDGSRLRQFRQHSFRSLQVFALALLSVFGLQGNQDLHAQSKTRGVVVLATEVFGPVVKGQLSFNNLPVEGSVFAKRGDLIFQFKTDESGHFEFNYLEKGEWYLLAMDLAGHSLEKIVALPENGIVEIDLQLSATLNEAETIKEVESTDPNTTGTLVFGQMITTLPSQNEKCKPGQETVFQYSDRKPITDLNTDHQVNFELGTENETGLSSDLGSEGSGFNESIDLQIRLSPIPAKDWLAIFIEKGSGASLISISLTSLEGKVFKNQTISGNTGSRDQVDISNLPAGLYLFRAIQNGSVFEGKFLKL